VKLLLFRSKPLKKQKNEHTSILRFLIYRLMTQKYVEHVIITAIVLNTLVLTLNHFEEPEALTLATSNINIFFVSFFTIEAVLKITAFGKSYFHEPWNAFDFFVVVGSLIGVIMNSSLNTNLDQAASLFRAFRIFKSFETD